MLYTLIIQIIILVIVAILPVSKRTRTIILATLVFSMYKSILIAQKLIELVCKIIIGQGHISYRNIAGGIFKNNFRFHANFEDIPSKPSILVTTYPVTLLEYLVPVLIPGSTCLLASGSAKKWMSMVYPDTECCYIPTKKGGRYSAVKEIVKERLKDSHVIIYVENKERRYGRSVGNLWKGAFNMAKDLGVTVTPLVIDNVYEDNCSIPEQNFNVYVGSSFQVLDPMSTLIQVRTLMREKKEYFKRNKFTV